MPNTTTILIAGAVIAGGIALAARSKDQGKATEAIEDDFEALETQNHWKDYVRAAIRVIDKPLFNLWVRHDTLPIKHLTRFSHSAQKLENMVSAYEQQDEKTDIDTDSRFLRDFSTFLEQIMQQNFHAGGDGESMCAALLDLKATKIRLLIKTPETDTSGRRTILERLRNIEMQLPGLRAEWKRKVTDQDEFIAAMSYTIRNVVWEKVEEYLVSADE